MSNFEIALDGSVSKSEFDMKDSAYIPSSILSLAEYIEQNMDLLKVVNCDECGGTGEVEFNNDYNEYECDCKSCDGDGNKMNFDMIKTMHANKIAETLDLWAHNKQFRFIGKSAAVLIQNSKRNPFFILTTKQRMKLIETKEEKAK